MDIIVVTTWTHSFLYRRTASERSVEALFRMLAGLIFGHLHNEHVRRIANDGIDNPSIDQTNGLPCSRRTNKITASYSRDARQFMGSMM